MKVRLVGASGVIAGFLIPRLIATGHQVIAHTRAQQSPPSLRNLAVDWRLGEAAHSIAVHEPADALIWLGPLNLFAPATARNLLQGVAHCIAFSSTSALTKRDSGSGAERATAALIADSEQAARVACGQAGVAWTLFRPTLIYGGGRDANLSALAAMIERLGWLPLPRRCHGLRQPVHADDLAQACVLALRTSRSHGKIYALPGATTLSYRAMTEAVFRALARPVRIVTVPEPVLRFAVAALARWRGRDWNAEMVRRMALDLVFDAAPAIEDFAYSPREFVLDAGMLGRPTRPPTSDSSP